MKQHFATNTTGKLLDGIAGVLDILLDHYPGHSSDAVRRVPGDMLAALAVLWAAFVMAATCTIREGRRPDAPSHTAWQKLIIFGTMHGIGTRCTRQCKEARRYRNTDQLRLWTRDIAWWC